MTARRRCKVCGAPSRCSVEWKPMRVPWTNLCDRCHIRYEAFGNVIVTFWGMP